MAPAWYFIPIGPQRVSTCQLGFGRKLPHTAQGFCGLDGLTPGFIYFILTDPAYYMTATAAGDCMGNIVRSSTCCIVLMAPSAAV